MSNTKLDRQFKNIIKWRYFQKEYLPRQFRRLHKSYESVAPQQNIIQFSENPFNFNETMIKFANWLRGCLKTLLKNYFITEENFTKEAKFKIFSSRTNYCKSIIIHLFCYNFCHAIRQVSLYLYDWRLL